MAEDGRGEEKAVDVVAVKKPKQGGFRTMPFILGNLILVSLLHKCCFFSLLDQAHMITSEHD